MQQLQQPSKQLWKHGSQTSHRIAVQSSQQQNSTPRRDSQRIQHQRHKESRPTHQVVSGGLRGGPAAQCDAVGPEQHGARRRPSNAQFGMGVK